MHDNIYVKANILAMSSDTHQLHYIPLHHFTNHNTWHDT